MLVLIKTMTNIKHFTAHYRDKLSSLHPPRHDRCQNDTTWQTWFNSRIQLHDLHTKSLRALREWNRTSTDGDGFTVQFTEHVVDAHTQRAQLPHHVRQRGHTDKLQLILYWPHTAGNAWTPAHTPRLHGPFYQRHLNSTDSTQYFPASFSHNSHLTS